MRSPSWQLSDAFDQSGRVAVVTGANSGIGFIAARELARLGARTVLACRDHERGDRALQRLRSEVPRARAELLRLDLADLDSVREAAESLRGERVDLLVNNAGVMALPYRTTADGFEMQFGTNHLGHFALTGLVLPSLLTAPAPRVVTVSSGLHQFGRMNFDDPHGRRRYGRWTSYSQSKLANLLFSGALQRAANRSGSSLQSVAAHPGMAGTNLAAVGPALQGRERLGAFLSRAAGTLGQSEEMGALATLRAALDPGVPGDSYIGPTGMFGLRGVPRRCPRASAARDQQAATRLWKLSEEQTGVTYAWD